MAGKIPQPFIDQVLNQTDIVDLINSYIDLKPKGKEHIACCPFHGEKTPSFTVSPEKQFYHCFGCGAHGTAINFLMEHEGLQFVEAVEALAARLGLEIITEQGSFTSNNQELYDLLEAANKFYQSQLRNNQTAVDYLKSRGISGQMAAAFNIGYAPALFDLMQKQFGRQFDHQSLIKTGLVTEKSATYTYDRFRNRIMFPIKDTRGRVTGFGGRSINDDLPKYMNSPETALFHKGNTLYGIYEARQALGKLKRLIIVEGYMDVIALYQHNIKNCVATLGTATTGQNIRNLLRYSPQLVFCFDGDRAGKAAAWKALEQMLPEYKDGIDISFAFMPRNEDPDSLIRHSGEQAFHQFIEKAKPLSEYFFAQLTKDIDIASPDGRAKLASTAKPLLSRLRQTVFKDLMFKELNQRVGASVKPAATSHSGAGHAKAGPARRALKYTKTRLAIALLIRDPSLAQYALPLEELRRLKSHAGINLVIELINIIESQPDITPISLIERFHGQENYHTLKKLIMWDPPDMDNRELSFKQTMQRFKEDIGKQELDAIIDQEN